MAGGVGNPLIQDADIRRRRHAGPGRPRRPTRPTAPRAGSCWPSRALTGDPTPARTCSTRAGSTPPSSRADGRLDGLYLTKDFGQNWTQVRLPDRCRRPATAAACRPSRPTTPNLPRLRPRCGRRPFAAGQLRHRPGRRPDQPQHRLPRRHRRRQRQPGLIRVDTTGISDAHAFCLDNDQHRRRPAPASTPTDADHAETDRAHPTAVDPLRPRPADRPVPSTCSATRQPVRRQRDVPRQQRRLGSPTTAPTSRWIPFDDSAAGPTSTASSPCVDPLTGHDPADHRRRPGRLHRPSTTATARFVTGASARHGRRPTGSRNGNLQITQFYYGAVAAQHAGRRRSPAALFYGQRPGQRLPAAPTPTC